MRYIISSEGDPTENKQILPPRTNPRGRRSTRMLPHSAWEIRIHSSARRWGKETEYTAPSAAAVMNAANSHPEFGGAAGR